MRISRLQRTLQKIVPVRDSEIPATLWSAAYIFCLLCAYYVLRSVRDEIGSEHVRRLPDYWLSVFFLMLVLVPLYAAIASRWPRRTFIRIANRFFNLNLIALFIALHLLTGEQRGVAEWVFYVWLSGFVMFVLTVFWGFMADVFRSEQGKRLFGFIAFGGSLGGITGPAITALVVEHIGQVNLFLISIVLLELANVCMRKTDAHAPDEKTESIAARPVPGAWWHGFAVMLRSPYLLGIGAFIFLFTYGSTMIYFQKAEIARSAFEDRDARTAFYAIVDLSVNTLALLGQVFLTGRILPRLGVAKTLIVLPVLTMIGFAAVGAWPTLAVLVAFEIVRRSCEFALGKPTREVLFTVVDREKKYKSKAFLDTVVYRGSDVVTAQIHEGLRQLGLGLSAIAYVAVPVAGVWALLGWSLGRRQDELAQADEPS